MNQSKEKNDTLYLDEEVQKSIEFFLSRKRKQIVEILYKKERLSHGELAAGVDSSQASLSNILLKFDQFQYKLLDGVSEGKRRYYSLTELGRKYVESCLENNQYTENKNIVSQEPFRLMKDVRESLEIIKGKYEDTWELMLDNVLLESTEYLDIEIKEEEKEINDFLVLVEKVLLYGDENYSVKLMELVESNNILSCRFEKFLGKFETLKPLLLECDQAAEIMDIYDLLESIIKDRDVDVGILIRKLKWSEKTSRDLSDTIKDIIKHNIGKERSAIYTYFNRMLAGNRELSVYITKEVYAACKKLENKG